MSVDLTLVIPSVELWGSLLIAVGTSMVFGLVVGVVTHALESDQRLPRAVTKGLIAALALAAAAFPFVLNRFLHPHFMVFFTTATHAVAIFFRVVEALCGTYPRALASSRRLWMLYFPLAAEIDFAPKRSRPPQPSSSAPKITHPHPATSDRIGLGVAATCSTLTASSKVEKASEKVLPPSRSPPLRVIVPNLLARTGAFMFINAALLHAGAPLGFRPFGHLLGPLGPVLDVYYWALMLWTCGEWSTSLARVPAHFLGVNTLPAFKAPLILATSPRDFWGRRWNMIIHMLMHRTYFKPVADRTRSHGMGALAAFVASALFHEFMWAVCCAPFAGGALKYGEVTVFFVAQFLLCSLETVFNALAPRALSTWVSALPRAVKTASTAVLICAFGQLFCENLMRAHIFESMIELYPRLELTWGPGASGIGAGRNLAVA
mmetsp:Transcript_4409/g.10957  ORF Transcript_4409/g.10957 Transcript_4409/m.10957 type:complete len:434 (-) Transcript_4409:352-1653(-)